MKSKILAIVMTLIMACSMLTATAFADGVNCNYRRDLFPQFGDKVLTLSTCYRQNRTQRFLVQGVLTQEYTVLKK